MPNIPVFELKANEDLNRCEHEMRRVLILGTFKKKCAFCQNTANHGLVYMYTRMHI